MSEKTAVVLLHGIGAQEQRTTINEFLASLHRLKLSPRSEQQVVRQVGNNDDSFDYYYSESSIGDHPVTIAEYYWADLSRIRVGFLHVLVNYFQLVVDVPDIIYACLGPNVTNGQSRDYFVLRCLRSILAMALWIIYFPIMAANFAYAVLVAGFAVNVRLKGSLNLSDVADLTVVLSVSTAILATFLLIRLGILNQYFKALALMTMAILLAVFCIGLYGLFDPDWSLTFNQYSVQFQNGLNLLWLIVLMVSLIYLLLLPLLCLFFRKRWRAIVLGFATNFLVIRFWLFLITTIWLIYLTSVFEEQTYSELVGDIGGPIRFLSLIWLDIAVVGIALLVALAAFVLQTRSAQGAIVGIKYPRLIVPKMLPSLTVILAVLGLAIIFACTCSVLFPECTDMNCGFVDRPTEWIIANAATFLAIGGLIIQFTHSGFEVALDIVNYFKSDRGHRRVNPFAAMSSVFSYELEKPEALRYRLKNRLNILLNDIHEVIDNFDRTILVGHSLGSMVAIDLLKEFHMRGKKSKRLDLVTMGSPYTSIFNYYFPHMFASASAALLPNVENWKNIYSENDYVGGNLTDGQTGITELVQPPFGHVPYFKRDAIIEEIAKNITDPKMEKDDDNLRPQLFAEFPSN